MKPLKSLLFPVAMMSFLAFFAGQGTEPTLMAQMSGLPESYPNAVSTGEPEPDPSLMPDPEPTPICCDGLDPIVDHKEGNVKIVEWNPGTFQFYKPQIGGYPDRVLKVLVQFDAIDDCGIKHMSARGSGVIQDGYFPCLRKAMLEVLVEFKGDNTGAQIWVTAVDCDEPDCEDKPNQTTEEYFISYDVDWTQNEQGQPVGTPRVKVEHR